uniref:hypothetical protein n=1 Tax=Cutaneotrichosporon mucoides TaxID=82522 RepID=UPI00226CDB9E|nr:hypothetical protein OYW89_mgp10 [Cutaneotrichosporon mucoides]UZC57686.1 hypothetical protein [Cutaneotrichosporon mucoides]
MHKYFNIYTYFPIYFIYLLCKFSYLKLLNYLFPKIAFLLFYIKYLFQDMPFICITLFILYGLPILFLSIINRFLGVYYFSLYINTYMSIRYDADIFSLFFKYRLDIFTNVNTLLSKITSLRFFEYISNIYTNINILLNELSFLQYNFRLLGEENLITSSNINELLNNHIYYSSSETSSKNLSLSSTFTPIIKNPYFISYQNKLDESIKWYDIINKCNLNLLIKEAQLKQLVIDRLTKWHGVFGSPRKLRETSYQIKVLGLQIEELKVKRAHRLAQGQMSDEQRRESLKNLIKDIQNK